MSGLKDYEVENDKFEFDGSGLLDFMCAVCRWAHKADNEPPCCYCGHNVNAERSEP